MLYTAGAELLERAPPPSTGTYIKISLPFHKSPPLLAWECIGVHSTMERSTGASFGGWYAGFSGRVRVATYENPGFLNPGLRNL